MTSSSVMHNYAEFIIDANNFALFSMWAHTCYKAEARIKTAFRAFNSLRGKSTKGLHCFCAVKQSIPMAFESM